MGIFKFIKIYRYYFSSIKHLIFSIIDLFISLEKSELIFFLYISSPKFLALQELVLGILFNYSSMELQQVLHTSLDSLYTFQFLHLYSFHYNVHPLIQVNILILLQVHLFFEFDYNLGYI